ncbi:MAG: site-specific integrase [Syntrophobacteraceae bacterium]
MTFKEIAKWYLGQEKVKALRYYPTLTINLASFNQGLGDTIVGQIKPSDLENYQAKRKIEGQSDAYIDRQIEAARAMINKAFDNDMVTGETVKVFRRVRKMLKRGSNARNRILSTEEFKNLFDQLPLHTKAILATGFYTGMRRSEILTLTWDKVNMDKRVIRLEAEDTTDKGPRLIPILPELYQILEKTPRALHVECSHCHKKQPARNKTCECGKKLDLHVFLYRGKPVASIKTGPIKVCTDAEITYGRFVKDGFIFHDLRHAFNTYMRKAGVAQSVIMKITGHSTDEMFRRYDTIDADDAHQAIGQYGAFLRNLDQTLDQEAKEQ